MQRLWVGGGEHTDRRGNGAIWDTGIWESYALRGRPPAPPLLGWGMLVVLQGKEWGIFFGKKELEYVHMAPPISAARAPRGLGCCPRHTARVSKPSLRRRLIHMALPVDGLKVTRS